MVREMKPVEYADTNPNNRNLGQATLYLAVLVAFVYIDTLDDAPISWPLRAVPTLERARYRHTLSLLLR